MPQVKSVEYITKDAALVQWREHLKEQGEDDLTRYLDVNPLHASLNVKLVNASVFAEVVSALRNEEPVVEKVKEQQQLADQVVTVTNVLRTAGTVILVVIAFIVLFIIVNTIRLAVVARAEEIEIMRLVGASDAFIRWPFVFEGAMVGLLGAALTLAFLWIAADPIGQLHGRVLPGAAALRSGRSPRSSSILIGGPASGSASSARGCRSGRT